jgi:hypothetical protein
MINHLVAAPPSPGPISNTPTMTTMASNAEPPSPATVAVKLDRKGGLDSLTVVSYNHLRHPVAAPPSPGPISNTPTTTTTASNAEPPSPAAVAVKLDRKGGLDSLEVVSYNHLRLRRRQFIHYV